MSDSTKAPAKQKQEVDPYRYGWRYVLSKDPAGSETWEQVPLTQDDILHPNHEDYIVHGVHHDWDCRYLVNALEQAIDGRPGYQVFHDVRIDFGVQGIRPVCPDLIVFENVHREWLPDGTFMVAEVGARPLLVIEVTSRNTRKIDLETKVNLYRRAGVPLYAIVDYWPEEERRKVHVLGYRATPEGYLWIDLDEQNRLWLPPVRLWLAGDDNLAVCFDEQGQRIPNILELNRAVRKADARAEELQTLAEEAITARRDAEAKTVLEASERKQADQRAADLAAQLAAAEAELKRLRGTL